ncbi:MAG: protein-disulfide reductase DsbD domain-containing protein [Bauldia sp.]
MSFQLFKLRSRSPKPNRIVLFFAALAGALLISGEATAEIGDWVQAQHWRVRLLAAGPNPDGTLAGAIEIELDDGWKTYWRSPGDTGLTPLLDFAGSANVARVEVGFPPPRRWNDGYTVSNIYERHVVLPLFLTLNDPNSPVVIDVALQIGVCDQICIPADLQAAITVPPGFTDGRAAQAISAALALLPTAPMPGAFEVASVDRPDGSEDEPVFEIALSLPDGKTPELFVEGPTDWYAAGPPIEISRSGNLAVYHVGFDRVGSTTSIGDAALRITVVSGNQAIEQTVPLR